jgi:hypothetical protein
MSYNRFFAPEKKGIIDKNTWLLIRIVFFFILFYFILFYYIKLRSLDYFSYSKLRDLVILIYGICQ